MSVATPLRSVPRTLFGDGLSRTLTDLTETASSTINRQAPYDIPETVLPYSVGCGESDKAGNQTVNWMRGSHSAPPPFRAESPRLGLRIRNLPRACVG